MVIQMSDTDKTDPYWVKRYLYGTVIHDHRKGECRVDSLEEFKEIPFRRYSTAPCEFWAGRITRWRKYRPNPGLWGRGGDGVKSAAGHMEASARNEVRMALRRAVKSDCVEDVDVVPYRHRHNAVWDRS